ncbi:MAG: EpsD family peptidyl-prolyl cis-trans isomerase [Sphingopyxis solisilvae]|uniref:EpsD family peptidyl-prolyl cis-trans isomerase n=2 Tax=Sphingopyxis solisilvae TaxID=1886788 RepID=UPI0040371B87
MKYSITARLAMAGAAFISLGACSSEPTGQVVAVVNGEEITQQELNAEIAELPSPPVGDKQAIRRQVLQQIIERRLMAQIAKEDGLDRDPMYVIRERRLKEELLVQMYGVKTADTVRVPDAASVKKYLEENPGKFKERTAYLVDQISFDFPSDANILKALEADKTLAEVEETLKRYRIDYAKGGNSIDSGTLPTNVLNQILALPPGEPFIIPMQGKVVVSVITGRQPVPTTEQEASPMAAQTMRAENLGKVLRTRLEEAKAKASISYQDGLAPLPKKAAAK